MSVVTAPTQDSAMSTTLSVRRLFGFRKRYGLILFSIFGGSTIAFVLFRIRSADYHGYFCKPGDFKALPGECWTYNQQDYLRLGFQLHVKSILPATFLAVFQFLPVIRRNYMAFHRLSGYMATVLGVLSTIGGLMIAADSGGGTLEVLTVLSLLAVLFVGSSAISIYNIRRLQIDQHKVWALRAWGYACSVITMRPLFLVMLSFVLRKGAKPYLRVFQCDKLASFFDSTDELLLHYPVCNSLEAHAIVRSGTEREEQVTAAVHVTFGAAIWLSLALHILAVEAYIHMTSPELKRLRDISDKRQKDAGYSSPGRTGSKSNQWDTVEEMPDSFKVKTG